MNYDVAIIGAGPAGLSMALCLADTDLSVLLIDQLSAEELENPSYDGREIALTHASRKYLQQLQVWPTFKANELHRIAEAKVYSGDSAQTLDFNKLPTQTSELGYIVSNHCIRRNLYQKVKQLDNLRLMDSTSVSSVEVEVKNNKLRLQNGETVEAKLLIAADSRFSKMRNQMDLSAKFKDYARTAIVFTVTHQGSHQNTATECFNYGHTIAILPLEDNRSSIVITVDSDRRSHYENMSDDAMCEFVELKAQQYIGKIDSISERFYYPLVGTFANKFVNHSAAIIGDAAVGMHPVTAHGYNLGLQSAVILSEEIKLALSKNQDFASPEVLRRYEKKHLINSKIIYEGTNLVVKLFTSDGAPQKILRQAVLGIANRLSPLKMALTRKLTDA